MQISYFLPLLKGILIISGIKNKQNKQKQHNKTKSKYFI